jgi:hypothetical protein
VKLFSKSSAQVRAAAEAYRRDGVALIKGLLPAATVQAAQDAYRQLTADLASGATPLERSARFVSGGFLPGALGTLPDQPELAEVAREVIGPDVALYMNRLLIKDQVWNGPVATHQDCPYFHGSVDKMSIFVPLQPFTAETGNLKFVAGSHRYGNLGVRGTIRHEEFPQLAIVQPDAMPGDVILASFTVWHFSEAAAVQCERPVMQMAYQPASDGSYFGEPDQPRLICGQWRTDAFSRFRDHVTADG